MQPLRHRCRPRSGCCRMRRPSSPTRCSRRRARAPRLITTRGFRDVLELRRSARADLYDLFQDPPATLIPRRRRFEITERIGADGPGRHAARRRRDRRADRGAQGGARRGDRGLAAVQLPQSRARATARRAPARGACRAFPSICPPRCCRRSSEFERTSTTAVCAYVGPILASYLRAAGRRDTHGSACRRST